MSTTPPAQSLRSNIDARMQNRLCFEHLRRFSDLMSKLALARREVKPAQKSSPAGHGDDVLTLKRPRSASMSEISPLPIEKRTKLSSTIPDGPTSAMDNARSQDDIFREHIIRQIVQNFAHHKVV